MRVFPMSYVGRFGDPAPRREDTVEIRVQLYPQAGARGNRNHTISQRGHEAAVPGVIKRAHALLDQGRWGGSDKFVEATPIWAACVGTGAAVISPLRFGAGVVDGYWYRRPIWVASSLVMSVWLAMVR